jgi:hypothetical protein
MWAKGRRLLRVIFLVGLFFYSTLLHLPPLRFHCAGGCWDRIQDCCDATWALTARRSNHLARSHPQLARSHPGYCCCGPPGSGPVSPAEASFLRPSFQEAGCSIRFLDFMVWTSFSSIHSTVSIIIRNWCIRGAYMSGTDACPGHTHQFLTWMLRRSVEFQFWKDPFELC